MKKGKEVLITTETYEFISVRRRKYKSITCFCPVCRKKSEMVTVSDAVSDFNFEISEIIECVRSKKLHLLITKNKQHLLCSNSLATLPGKIA